MTQNNEAPGARILALWQKLHNNPLGRWLFHRVLAFTVPYSGSIKARVQTLEPGCARIALPLRRSNTNHLRSVHAVALTNLGELCSGLAMLTGLPPEVRGIVTHIATEYSKKARGDLLAEANPEIPVVTDERLEHTVQAVIRDADNDTVATVTVRWLLARR